MTDVTISTTEYVPLLAEIKTMFIENEMRDMIWNGEKWLRFAEVYPLMYFAQTGRPLVLDEGQKLR